MGNRFRRALGLILLGAFVMVVFLWSRRAGASAAAAALMQGVVLFGGIFLFLGFFGWLRSRR